MSVKQKIQNLVSPLYNKVWHGPKGKIRERLKRACDDMPHKTTPNGRDRASHGFHPDCFFVFGHCLLQDGRRPCPADNRDGAYPSTGIPNNDNPEVSPKIIEYEAAR